MRSRLVISPGILEILLLPDVFEVHEVQTDDSSHQKCLVPYAGVRREKEAELI